MVKYRVKSGPDLRHGVETAIVEPPGTYPDFPVRSLATDFYEQDVQTVFGLLSEVDVPRRKEEVVAVIREALRLCRDPFVKKRLDPGFVLNFVADAEESPD